MLTKGNNVFTCAFIACVFCTCIVTGQRWEPPSPPECQSHNNLCDVRVDVIDAKSATETPLPAPVDSPMCVCHDNKTCPISVNDQNRVLELIMTAPGQTIRTRLSYCDPLKRNHRKCSIGEVAVTMRGIGPVVLDVVGGVRCTCNQPLSIKKSRTDGLFSIQYYACGERECPVNNSVPPVCQRSKIKPGQPSGDVAVVTKYTCQCPPGYECSAEKSQAPPNVSGAITDFTCKKTTMF